MNNLEKVKSEFRCDPDGKAYITKRGLARLCGVNHNNWGQRDTVFTSEIDTILNLFQLDGGNQNGLKSAKSNALYSVEGGNRTNVSMEIPDTIAAQVITYYATRGNTQALQTLMAMSAIGLRTWIQQSVGWKPNYRSLTPEEIIELCCLPVPVEWQRRFPVEYYQELERLTGLKAFEHKRPTYWGKLTKELVYDYLPEGIYEAIKRCKAETGGWDKLHQFLSDQGISLLEQHQRSLLTLMRSASSITDLKRLLDNTYSQKYQLLLF